MPFLVSKFENGQLKRCFFSGNTDELIKAGKLIGVKLKNEAKLSFPADQVYISNLLSNFPSLTMDSRLSEWYNEVMQRDAKVISILSEEGQPYPVGNYVLKPFQDVARRFIQAGKRVMLCDSPGLGKTVTSVCSVIDAGEFDTVLVVVKAYLFEQWINTFKQADPNGKIKLFPLLGRKDKIDKVINEYKNTPRNIPKVIFCSYNALTRPNYAYVFMPYYQWVICDEAHTIFNHNNVTSKAVWQLTKQAEGVILLTGSDIKDKNIGNYWSPLHCIDPSRFSAYTTFYDRYMETYLDSYGKVPVGPKHMDELAEVLAPIRIRRTMDEVGFQLPEQIITTMTVDLEPAHRAIYDHISREEMKQEFTDFKKGIATFSYLQRLVSFPVSLGFESFSPKLPTIVGLVEDSIANGQKVAIFTIHREFSRHLHWYLENSKMPCLDGERAKFVQFDGETPVWTRDKLIDMFKTDDHCFGLIATLKTGGEGLDLPDCDVEIIAEGHWNPEVMKQVYGRILRLTSRNNKIVYKIIARNTIDTYIDFVATDKENFINESNAVFKICQMMKKGEKD